MQGAIHRAILLTQGENNTEEIHMNGKLCFAGFELGTGIEWMVRREAGKSGSVWVLYRAGVQYSRHNSPRSAHEAYSMHVAPTNDLESSLSR